MSRYTGNHIRLAVITDVDHDTGVVKTEWMDQTAEVGPDVNIPHPFAGRGEGIFVGPREGQIIALDAAAYERWIPVGVLPMRAFYSSDLAGTDEVGFNDVGFPQMNAGEIIIQGLTGAQLAFTDDGDLGLFNPFGEGILLGGDSDSSHRCTIKVNTPVEYVISQTGLKASGIVRRDIRVEDSEEDFAEFLFEPASEQALEEIGWDPNQKVSLYTGNSTEDSGDTGKQDSSLRNPAFVESRNLVFEFGRRWLVDNPSEEASRFVRDDIVLRVPDERRERRSNVLSLSLTHPNELIESVDGTLVDIFGNLLDINRNVIALPTGKGVPRLTDTLEKVRHTVALHREINTRKGWGYRKDKGLKPICPLTEGPDILTSANNTRDRSRWVIDVDKEGLTKINIPASSETGNIPMLTRYETSSVLEIDEKGNFKNKARAGEDSALLFRNEKNQDIFLDQFGPGGIKILGNTTENRFKGKKTSWVDSANTQKTFGKNIESGTAFHDITSTAAALLKENINKNASDIFTNPSVTSDPTAVATEIDARVPTASSTATRNSTTGLVTGQPNAGGRSLHLNLDGSLESSIGANTVDRVSWILDTAGALVARLGRDRQGRSAIIHADGTIAVEVGGFDFVGEGSIDEVDTRFVGRGQSRTSTLPGDPNRFRSGKVVLRIRRSNAASTGPDIDDHLVIIDETGVTIQTAGRMNFVSDMDMTLQSKSRLLLDAPKVQIYESNPKLARRDSRPF